MNLSPDQRIAGILIPTFAIRTEYDLGIGDTASLKTLVDWAAEHGLSVVQLLPINETGRDNSPYNAISSAALEPSTIATTPEALPDLKEEDYQDVIRSYDLQALRRGGIDYPVVKRLKRALLQKAFASFCTSELQAETQRAQAFLQFRKKHADWLEGYALFRILIDRNDGVETYDSWPETQRTAMLARQWIDSQTSEERQRIGEERNFVSYIQWVAYTQWQEVHAYANERRVALMGDVPMGISYYSADVYTHPELFRRDWSGGAPPETIFDSEPFVKKWGQNWGIPLYDWNRMRRDHFAWWRRRIGLICELFDVVRIDHILGMYRIYAFPWRPEKNLEFLDIPNDLVLEKTNGRVPQFMERGDDSLYNKELNRQQGDEILRTLLRAAGDSAIVGEDLGVVPDYVRPHLASLGIPGFKIPNWEIDYSNGQLIPGCMYPRCSVTTYATHDHDPMKVYWNRTVKRAVQLNPSNHAKLQAEIDTANWELFRLCEYAGILRSEDNPFPLFDDTIHEKLLEALFQSNSWMAICMITDLIGSTQRFNVPGAISSSNWSERLSHTIAEMRQHPEVSAKMQRISEIIRASGRIIPSAPKAG